MPLKPVNLWGSLVGPTPSFYDYIHRGSAAATLITVIEEILTGEGFAFYFQEATGSSVAVDSGPNSYNANYSSEGLTVEGLTQLGRAPFNSTFTSSANVSGAGNLSATIPTTDLIPAANVKPRGPGTFIGAYSHDRVDNAQSLLRFKAGGEDGLRFEVDDTNFVVNNGDGNQINLFNRFTRYKNSLVRLAVFTVNGSGDVVLYLDGEQATTASGWSTAAWSGSNLGVEMLGASSFNEGKAQNITWVTDYIADQTKVTELWEAFLQKEVEPRSTFNPTKLTEIPILDYPQQVLFYHAFEGDSTTVNGVTVDYSFDGSNPAFDARGLTTGANGHIANNGDLVLPEPRLGPLTSVSGVYIGNVSSSERHSFTVVGHGARNGDKLTLTNVVTDPGGSPLPSYEGKTYSLTAVNADTVSISEFFGTTSDMLATLNFNARSTDVFAATIDTGETDVVIDMIMDTNGVAGDEAGGGAVVRYVDENNYYRIFCSSNRYELYECVSGTESTVGFANASGSTDTNLQRFRIRVVGDKLSLDNWNYKYEIGTSSNTSEKGFASYTMTNFLTATKFGPALDPNKDYPDIISSTVKYFTVLKPMGL
jgi:hypothetical protein